MTRYLAVILIIICFIPSCAPTPLLVTKSDIGRGNAFVINMMKMNGSNTTKSLIGTFLGGGKNSFNVDVVHLFHNTEPISSLNAASIGGANMGQILAVSPGSCQMEVDSYYGKQNKLFGYKIIDLNLEKDRLYAFVTEVDKSEDDARIDVYKLGFDDLLEIIVNSKELSTFEFTEKYYDKITSAEKLYELSFDKK